MREFDPTLFIIRNKDSINQTWKLYINGVYKIIACFQDTYQRFYDTKNMKNMQRMGWITAWIQTQNIPDSILEQASIELTDSVSSMYDYIWMNRAWVGSGGSSRIWKDDGAFYWYTYQWSTGIRIQQSYCIQT